MAKSKVTFNGLAIGTIAYFHNTEFVKIKDAEVDKIAPCQYPNAVNLDNGHYIVISYNAECEVIKTPKDYPPRDLFYDLEE